MLHRVSNKIVRGPTFVVSIPDIHRVEYTEDEKVAIVEIEGGLGPGNQVNWSVYAETLRGWEPPHENIEMSRAKWEEILSHISKSLELLEMAHQIEW
jgi:hypothetical protein